MRKDVYFLPLSGGAKIDANCYFLKLGPNKILLDCGSCCEAGLIRGPNFLHLLKSGMVNSLQEITHVFISHAHLDHVGYLPQLLKELPQAAIYMTPITEMLLRYQFFDNELRKETSVKDEVYGVVLEGGLNRVRRVSFLETLNLGSFKATFFQAGHIPGAMMTLFEYGGQSILYTGDYSFEENTLTEGCLLPEGLQVDSLLMCATNARRPWYSRKNNLLLNQSQALLQKVVQQKSVFCAIHQLSKGIELLSMLNYLCRLQKLKIPIYLDASMMNVVERLEKVGVVLLKENNFPLINLAKHMPHITISQDKYTKATINEEKVNVDFTLHDDYEEMKSFICSLNPRKTLLVHCAAGVDTSLQEELLWEPEYRGELIYCEDGSSYRLDK